MPGGFIPHVGILNKDVGFILRTLMEGDGAMVALSAVTAT